MHRAARAQEDGYRSELVPGLKASGDAERLCDELAFGTARLGELAADPPGLYAEIAAPPDIEEATWLAFLCAYLSPSSRGNDPFAAVRAAHVPWATGGTPDLAAAEAAGLGPRAAHEVGRDERTVAAYRGWVARAGSQRTAFAGDGTWTPQRRFDRLFERLALPGFGRAARMELLVLLGRLGVHEIRPTSLHLAADATTVAAKRVFGIGDTINLERRAAALADAADVPVEALDLALFNWAQPDDERATLGATVTADDGPRGEIAAALGVA